MSSLDQHTHCGYQTMLPEAVAVVLAPRDASCPCGVFRLTDRAGASGLRLVQQCEVSRRPPPSPLLPVVVGRVTRAPSVGVGAQLRGFHPHPKDFPLVEHCGHTEFAHDLEVAVVDLRA
jgi:hypothetical protein